MFSHHCLSFFSSFLHFGQLDFLLIQLLLFVLQLCVQASAMRLKLQPAQRHSRIISCLSPADRSGLGGLLRDVLVVLLLVEFRLHFQILLLVFSDGFYTDLSAEVSKHQALDLKTTEGAHS